jgi:hypothetical protein
LNVPVESRPLESLTGFGTSVASFWKFGPSYIGGGGQAALSCAYRLKGGTCGDLLRSLEETMLAIFSGYRSSYRGRWLEHGVSILQTETPPGIEIGSFKHFLDFLFC